jgi:predicted deacylase
VTDLRWLSQYVRLRDTPGDSAVYVLDSGEPGATLLVVGGTHANEIAGMAAATLLVERAEPTRGRMIVIPRLNSSGLTYVDASNPQPSWIRLDAASGTRYLRYGARFVHPLHQGQSDPERYILPGSTATLPGEEQRNINRAYPGLVDGPLTQRVAAAVMELILREGVDIAWHA